MEDLIGGVHEGHLARLHAEVDVVAEAHRLTGARAVRRGRSSDRPHARVVQPAWISGQGGAVVDVAMQIGVAGGEAGGIFTGPGGDIDDVVASAVLLPARLTVELAAGKLVAVAVAGVALVTDLAENAVVDVIDQRPRGVHNVALGAERVVEIPVLIAAGA